MPDDLLTPARDQTERSDSCSFALQLYFASPEWRARSVALGHGTFRRALTGATDYVVDGDFLLGQARLIAAAVAPDLLPDIPSSR